MLLSEVIKQHDNIHKLYKQAKEMFEKFTEEVCKSNCFMVELEELLQKNLDAGRILKGRAILDIKGRVTDVVNNRDNSEYTQYVRSEALEFAKSDAAKGFQHLQKEYIGVKNYSAFGDQRSDAEYYRGPKHGTIVFSIGLTNDFRERIKTIPPTEDEIENALYLLTCLPEIEEKKNNE